MCGIAGFIVPEGGSVERHEPVIRRMTDTLVRRGPDGGDVWVGGNVALGHRRLAVIDPSPMGLQPMSSVDGRYVIVFNGEVYNHAQLREELDAAGQGAAWRGHSDTETLLQAFSVWGVESTLDKLVGMFAMALWDASSRRLYLVRDRFGEKPLYYGWVADQAGPCLVFGSELKALTAYPGLRRTVCQKALSAYLQRACVPAPYSIYEHVYKVEPGCMVVVDQAPPPPPVGPVRPGQRHGSMLVHRWWSLDELVNRGRQHPLANEGEALEELDARLSQAILLQSTADVPLGAFLSGGVDSSAIVALMQKQSSRPIRTFTAAFQESGFDESPYAQSVARHLGTDHTTLLITAQEALSVVRDLPCMYDEPFADSSQIPTHLVCRAARQHVTVALSGDAGDESFGGYNRHAWGPQIWRRLRWLPYPARRQLGAFLNDRSLDFLDQWSGHMGVVRPGEKLYKLTKALDRARSCGDLYANLVSEWRDPQVVQASFDPQAWDDILKMPWPSTQDWSDDGSRMMYADSMSYLPDDILCKMDRAAMAVGLETRVPFLDHRVVELAWRLPMSLKVREGEGKRVLRQLVYRHVPKPLIDRPKAGFAMPVGQWLRGGLKTWADELLDARRLREQGFLLPDVVQQAWAEHQAGSNRWTGRLWTVLMFQAWLEWQR